MVDELIKELENFAREDEMIKDFLNIFKKDKKDEKKKKKMINTKKTKKKKKKKKNGKILKINIAMINNNVGWKIN